MTVAGLGDTVCKSTPRKQGIAIVVNSPDIPVTGLQ